MKVNIVIHGKGFGLDRRSDHHHRIPGESRDPWAPQSSPRGFVGRSGGQGQGFPLVLFHGWGFDSSIWSPLLPDLTSQYQLFLVDLPGFGLTPLMDWSDFKIALLKQLPETFAVAGWSMGGLYATRLAIEETKQVTHLVNIASSPCFIREKKWPGVDRQLFNAFYNELAKNPEKTLQQFIELQLQGQSKSSIVLGPPPSLPGLRAGLHLLLNWDLRQSITQLNRPVCYMFGRLDAITPRKTMTTMQTLYSHFKYVLFAQSAHAPFLSNPAQFVAALGDFLQ